MIDDWKNPRIGRRIIRKEYGGDYELRFIPKRVEDWIRRKPFWKIVVTLIVWLLIIFLVALFVYVWLVVGLSVMPRVSEAG